MEIINENFNLDIYGFSGIAVNKDYVRTAFGLMDRMWQAVKSNNLKNKGLNVFVYEEGEKVFAGVELNYVPEHSIGLERKSITLIKYAYYKHIGSYNLIQNAGQNMRDELKSKGLETCLPYFLPPPCLPCGAWGLGGIEASLFPPPVAGKMGRQG